MDHNVVAIDRGTFSGKPNALNKFQQNAYHGLLIRILAAVSLQVNVVAADPTRALDADAVNLLSRMQDLAQDQNNYAFGCLPRAIRQFSESTVPCYQSLLDGKGETCSLDEHHKLLSEQVERMRAHILCLGSKQKELYNEVRKYEDSLSGIFLPSSADERDKVRYWFDPMHLFKGAARNETIHLVSSLDHELRDISGHLLSIEKILETKAQSLVALSSPSDSSEGERRFEPDRLDAEYAEYRLLEAAFRSTKAALMAPLDPMEGPPFGGTAAERMAQTPVTPHLTGLMQNVSVVKQALARLQDIVHRAQPSQPSTENQLLKMQDRVSADILPYLTACGNACIKCQEFYGKLIAHGTGSYAAELSSVSRSMSDLRSDAKKAQDAYRELKLDFKKDSSSISDFCAALMTKSEEKVCGTDDFLSKTLREMRWRSETFELEMSRVRPDRKSGEILHDAVVGLRSALLVDRHYANKLYIFWNEQKRCLDSVFADTLKRGRKSTDVDLRDQIEMWRHAAEVARL